MLTPRLERSLLLTVLVFTPSGSGTLRAMRGACGVHFFSPLHDLRKILIYFASMSQIVRDAGAIVVTDVPLWGC